MQRAVTIVVILAVAIGLSFAGYVAFGEEREIQDTDLQTITVERGTIEATVNTAGNIEPEARVSLTFKVPGEVQSVAVERSQTVQAGDTLARLESADLELAIQQAQANLDISQARLAQTLAGPSEDEIAAAQASLESAQASYDKLLAGPTQDEITVAKAALEQARAALEQAQAAYDEVADLPFVGMLPQALQLEQATIAYESALASYNIQMAGPSELEIKAAEAQVLQAQATLERLTSSPTPEEVAIAQAQVDQAQAALEQAQLALENATLVAPFDGVIAALNVRTGESAPVGLPAIVLVDLSSFHIDVEVDEIDIGQVQVGQKALITLDALPEVEIGGHVASIAPTASTGAGVVSYVVTVALDPTDAPLRADMSANVTITTTRLEDALLVPNRAIQLDRQNGKTYVERMVDDLPTRVEIETGMRNEQMSEVVAGLEEGDVRVYPVDAAQEVRSRVAWIGWRQVLRAWRCILPLYLRKPAMRSAIKGLMDTPREWFAFLGYVLLAGRKILR